MNTAFPTEISLKTILDSVSEIFFVFDHEFRIIYWNKTAEEKSGLSSSETINKNLLDILPMLANSRFESYFREVMLTGEKKNFELEYPVEGGKKFFEINAYPCEGGVAVLAKDISSYKENEISREFAELRYRQTLDNMLEGCAIFDSEWRYVYVNEANARHAHHTRDELLGKTLHEIFPGIEDSIFFKTYKKVMASRIPEHLTADFVFPDGSKSWYEVRVVPVPEGIFILSIDVTQRKKDEEDLLHFRNVLSESEELANVGSWWIDIHNGGDVVKGSVTWSDGFYRILGYKSRTISPSIDNFLNLVHPDDRVRVENNFYDSLKNRSNYKIEFRIITPDKTEHILLEHGVMNFDSTGKLCRVMGALQDITSFRNAEFERERVLRQFEKERDKLKISLAEKETLLRELYHRTKNNMQVISSVMSLKANSSNDKNVSIILEDMQSRVRTLALVHQKLYQSKNLSRIDLKDYISDLIDVITSAYIAEPGRISVNKKLQHIEVLIDTAIPCGLIINELVSNSCKYAFTDGRRGLISVSLSLTQDQKIELIISDDGIGIDKEKLADDRKLGLKLFQILSEDQLQAETSLDTTKGVKWTIRFRDTLYNERI